MKKIILLLALTVATPTFLSAAEMGPQGGGREGHPGPPQVFFDACKGKKDGDALTMQNPQGQKVSGACRIVWVPAMPPQGQGQGGQPPRQGQGQNNPPPPNR
jgi:hypothetical protein